MLPQPEELLRIAEALRAGAAHSPRVQRERESTHRNRRIALVSCCASGSKLLHARGDWNGPSRRRSRSRRALRSEGRARPEVPTAIFPRRVLRSPRPSQRPSESDAPAEAQAPHKQQYSGQSEIHPIIPNPYRAAVCLAPTLLYASRPHEVTARRPPLPPVHPPRLHAARVCCVSRFRRLGSPSHISGFGSRTYDIVERHWD